VLLLNYINLFHRTYYTGFSTGPKVERIPIEQGLTLGFCLLFVC